MERCLHEDKPEVRHIDQLTAIKMFTFLTIIHKLALGSQMCYMTSTCDVTPLS